MISPSSSEKSRRPLLDFGLPLAFGAAIVASRIPAILCDCELNVDESQLIAQVRRYQLDLLPWRSVNGDTGGPLNTWYLLAAHLLGMPLEYAWVHALAAATLAATVILAYIAARRFFGREGAFVAGVFGTLWAVLHQVTDFSQYASELVPNLLVVAAVTCVGRSFRSDVAAALFLGLMPWAKLQVVPIGVVIGAWLVAPTLWPGNADPGAPRQRIRRAALIVAAAALPSALMIYAVAKGGAWEDCRRAYFVTNLSYAGEAVLAPFLLRAADCVALASTVAPWCIGLIAAALLVPWRRAVAARFMDWRAPSGLALGIVAASVFAWARTRTEWAHYDFFLLPGLILATAAIMAPGTSSLRARGRARAAALAVAVAYALVLAKPAVDYGRSLLVRRQEPQEADGLLGAIRALAPGFRTMAIWGWRPSIYVRGGITPPTRQANCGFLFIDNPSRDFLRARYAGDLEKSLPDLVLDSGGMSFEKFWHGVHLVEVPELAPVIRAHYALKGTIDAKDGTAYIYALKKP
ncbi:MAG TPA: hypothetical protein VII09_09395 [Opitutaceae bacterium]